MPVSLNMFFIMQWFLPSLVNPKPEAIADAPAKLLLISASDGRATGEIVSGREWIGGYFKNIPRFCKEANI